ncbi:MAG: TonB-dependent receptor [Bacteroidia bacterium]|nr:TonB-dependent receptor [Bacteroidia bacterium]
MNHKIFLILYLLIFNNCLLAQQGRLVQGTITDTNHHALSEVTIKLYINGTKDTLNTLSEENGSFKFSQVATSKFVVVVSSIRYETYTGNYNFAESAMNIRLEEITLVPFVKILQEVFITYSPPVVIKTDTIEYKADSFKVKQDAFVEDLLKKLPGIQVNKNGVITAQGKQVNKIKINGKDFFGGNIKAATQELPSNIIDKVQVIDDYGDIAAVSGIKDGEPNKVINLQLKKDKSHGTLGKAEAGYGSSKTYKASLSTNFFNDNSQFSVIGKSNNINNGFVTNSNKANFLPGGMSSGSAMSFGAQTNSSAGLQQSGSGVPQGITTSHALGTNFRMDFGKNNSFYGSYDYGNRNTYGFREMIHQIFYPLGSYINNQRYEFNNTGNSHQAYLNLEIYPDSFSYVKVSPSFYYNNNRNSNATDFDYFKDTFIKTTEGYVHDTTTSRTPVLGVDILYNRWFKKPGRNLSVTLNLNSSITDRKSFSPSFTRIFEPQGVSNEVYQNQLINQDNKDYNYNFYLAYSEPLAKNKFIDLTYFHNLSKSSNERKTFQHNPITKNDSLLSALSNVFTSRYTNDRLGLNFRTVKKNYNYSFGMSILPVSVKNYLNEKDVAYKPNNSVNISPLARFTSTFSKTESISITYNGNAKRPSSLQLQPIKDISNPQFQIEGNPDLKPEFFHNVNLSFNSFKLLSGRTLFTGLNLRTVQNKIIDNLILLDNNGTQLRKPENISGGYSISGFYTITKPFQLNKYVFSLNGSVNYNQDPILVNNKKAINTNWFISQELLFTYNNKWIEMSAGADYSLSTSRNILNQPTQIKFTSWVLSHDMRMDLPGKLVVKYNIEYVINNGLTTSLQKNIILMNSVIEKKILKNSPVYLSISGYNIFNQNSFFTRQFSANSFTDTRSLQLNRYFLITFNYRWNKFHGNK